MRRIIEIFALILSVQALAGCGSREEDTAIPQNSEGKIPILLFNGRGTSPGDVAATERVLINNAHLSFSTVNSSQLNHMTEAQLREYRLLIIPGGNFIKIGEGLSSNSMVTVRTAISNGMNYLGICAGAFVASDSGFNCLNLTSGVRFKFYAAEERSIRKAAVPVTAAGGPTLDQYWEDGPQLSGWGAVVARYPDNTDRKSGV